jgi:hypothetical protein
VQKGIPIPENGAGRPRSYPFKEMAIGDSFFMAGKNRYRGLYTSARHAGVKIVTRTVTENGERGLRCWRVA